MNIEPLPQAAHRSGSVVIPEGLPDPYVSLQDENPSNWVPFFDQDLHTRRPLKVVCIGAGFSGLTVAYKIKHEYNLKDVLALTIYEKNGEVGGTWYENIYPGVSCDIPIHAYSFPFNPNPYFSKTYCSGAEIEEYIKATTDKYGLREFIQLHSKVVETAWDDSNAKWNIKVESNGATIEDECDVLIDSSGLLNEPVWPSVEGMDIFKGKLLHSARWDASYDPAGKRIAVIGNGSSGIQLVTALQPEALHLVNYIRNPTWISPPIASNVTHAQNSPYTKEQQDRWKQHPDEFLAYRKKLDASVNSVFHLSVADHPLCRIISDATRGVMQHRLEGSKELADKLIPKDFPVGCRRLTPGEGYLEALQKSNTSCETREILRFTATGIETAAGVEDFDLVVCATGFDATFRPRWKMVGREPSDLGPVTDDPMSYFGIAFANMPNYFRFNGPNGANGHGSEMQHTAWTTDYILKWCEKMANEDIRSFCVKQDAVNDFYVYCQELLKRTVWSGHCRSWYNGKKKGGKVTALYGGSLLHFKAMLDTIRGEDYDIRYNSKNRFRFMGNGFTHLEKTGGDMAYYLTT